jgi:hypothetical protein
MTTIFMMFLLLLSEMPKISHEPIGADRRVNSSGASGV